MEGGLEERETNMSTRAAEKEEEVMSEVHLGCPPHLCGPYISHFSYSLPSHGVKLTDTGNGEDVNDEPSSPHQVVDYDEIGDLILPRRSTITRVAGLNGRSLLVSWDKGMVCAIQPSKTQLLRTEYTGYDDDQSSYSGCVSIRHNVTSTIPSVGLQVWRAELVLADYVLHNMFMSSMFNGVVAVELGAGTGLVGILLARVAKAVYITDHGVDILENCASNVHTNSRIFRNDSLVKVRELDWQKPWPPLELDSQCSLSRTSRYSWTSSEVEEVNRAPMLLAADVIYSDDLTDAFFSILQKLMWQDSKKVLYLALEKRYNFTMSDLDVVANGYSHFLSYMTDEKGFIGKCIDLSDIPQYVRAYERGNDVELWEIKYAA